MWSWRHAWLQSGGRTLLSSLLQATKSMNFNVDNNLFPCGLTEIREFVDENGKIIGNEVVDISQQMNDFQSIIEKTKASGEEHAERAAKQQEILDKLKDNLAVENSIGSLDVIVKSSTTSHIPCNHLNRN